MRLAAPKGLAVRPTADRVKEALFNIVGQRVVGATVADLFAGSGSLGIEALSRGANKAVFVEKDPRARAVLTSNLSRTRLDGKAAVVAADVRLSVAALGRRGKRFDLIFVDPPYRMGSPEVQKLISELARQDLLNPQGLIVYEHSRRQEPPEIAGLCGATRVYGESALTFYGAEESGERPGGEASEETAGPDRGD